MSIVPDDINSADAGADFVRANLHIHSYGAEGSYDVKDPSLTPETIVDSAIDNGIKVIAITDHQKIGNSKLAVEYAASKDILVIPGVELSTNEGHLLVYAPTIDKLQRIIGRLEFSDDFKSCRCTIKTAGDLTVEQGGFAIVAHIDNDSGFENAIVGYGDPKIQILKHSGILGIEVSSKDFASWFTEDDDQEQRKILAKMMVDGRGFTVADRARIMSSDAHETAKLWVNASGDERITRIKMADLDFESARTALLDPTARVKLEENIPHSVPRFIGAKFEGGFLDGQVVRFNKNLNAIIGGRGSGKSTLVESVKVASGNQTQTKESNEFRLVDGDVWSEKITLYYQDEVGSITEFTRSKGEELLNKTDPIDGITQVPIESYGQGDLTKVISDSESEPQVLNDFLDRFIDFGDLKVNDDLSRADLLTNHSKITELDTQISQLPRYEELFKDKAAKLKALKTENVKELVELEQSLAIERSLRQEINQEMDHRKGVVEDGLKAVGEFTLEELLEDKNVTIGKVEIEAITEQVQQYSKLANDASADFNTKSAAIISTIDKSISSWEKKEQSQLQKINDKKEELIAKGVTPDMAWIKTLADDYAKYERKIRGLKAKQVERTGLLGERAKILARREQYKRDIYARRISFAQRMNSLFDEAVVDYDVKIKYKQGLFSPSFAEYIQKAMEWRTAQVPKAPLIAKNMSPHDFLVAIKARDTSAFTSILDNSGAQALTALDIAALIQTFANLERQRDVEELIFEDRPAITVSKTVIDTSGNATVIPRDFHKLSLGQQQAICLTILLNSGKSSPLIIDQPEDNLDSEFIYKTLVTTLRRIKEKRQVIVVTHNANIAVLGDAELIIPLRSTHDKAVITDRGSIDKNETKVIACTILEGGDFAFNRRKEMYGLDKK